MRRTGWFLLAALLCTWAAVAMAAGPKSIRKQVQASMQVTGVIDIEVDGSVSDYRIDHPEKLPPDLVSLLENAVGSWKFDPVLEGNRPIAVSAKAGVRLIAKPADDGGHTVSIAGASFEKTGNDGYGPRKILMGPPRYPPALARLGVSGTVYLVLKVGRHGTVEDAIAEQVNLRVVGSEPQMKRMRDQLAQSALAAARGWTFSPPVLGPEVDASHWSMRIPVDFYIGKGPSDLPRDEYGRWVGYVPGPRRSIPWAEKDDDFQTAPDALLAGNFYSSRHSGPRLLTALGPN